MGKREFWILPQTGSGSETKPLIHVIEYSAFAALKAKLKIATAALEKIKTLPGYKITYEIPAKQGSTLFDIVDAQVAALAKINGSGEV